ncbi:hypothetical protein [Hydrocarboniphaga sp.]|uniref:hypothetical protein n=1 Tax=Hydrocarboniphaga sp. TaxID=2033016 RepID=UPI003D0DEC1E
MGEGAVVEQSLTYAGLGMAALGALGWLVWVVIRATGKRVQTDGSVDDRAVAWLDAIQKAYSLMQATADQGYQKVITVQETTIEALRVRLEKIQDELSQAYGRIAEMQDKHHAAMTETVGKVREENLVSNQRLHNRLDLAEENHRACEQRLQAQAIKMELLEKIYLPAGVTLQLGAGATVTSAPPAAAATAPAV